MNDRQIETIEQVRDFLAASAVMEFSVESVAERYAWVEATLGKFRYGTLSKTHKGSALKRQMIGGCRRTK